MRSLDQLLEAVAVALLEGRALGLAVVGEHDDLVGARSEPPRPGDAVELLVELAQGLHRVRPLQARVVRDLVVAREGGVDRGAAPHHVGQHAVDDQVADDHAHRRAQERVDAAAVPAGPDVAPGRADRRRPLQQHLPAEQDQGPGDVEAVGEERPVAGVRPLLRRHAADREDRLLGFAGEQVAAARAAVGEQAGAVRVPALDLRAVVRRRAGDEGPALLLHPAEGRDVVVGAEQDARLAGAGLRGEVGLPLGQAIAVLRQPPRHRRRAAVAHGVAQHRQRQPVDLEEEDPRFVGAGQRALTARHPLHDAQGVGVLVVGPDQHLEHQGDDRHRQRDQQRIPQRIDPDEAGKDVAGQLQQQRVDEQHRHEAERQGQRQPQRGHQRRQDGVQHRDQRRHQEGASKRADAHSRHQPGRDVERRRGEGPGESQPQRPEPWLLRLPLHRGPVCGRHRLISILGSGLSGSGGKSTRGGQAISVIAPRTINSAPAPAAIRIAIRLPSRRSAALKRSTRAGVASGSSQ